jgi:hypothetical protein
MDVLRLLLCGAAALVAVGIYRVYSRRNPIDPLTAIFLISGALGVVGCTIAGVVRALVGRL